MSKMLGILNTTCNWEKNMGVNAYNEPTYANSVTLPCAIYHETKLKQTDIGLVKYDEKYYVLHTNQVSDKDLINGEEVAVEIVKSLSGAVLYYRAVVLNA